MTDSESRNNSPAPRRDPASEDVAAPAPVPVAADAVVRASVSFDRHAWPRPAFALVLGLAAGLVLGRCLDAPTWTGPAGVSLSLGFHGLLQWLHAREVRRLPPPSGGLLLIAFAFIGLWLSAAAMEREARLAPIARWAASRWIVNVEGVLNDEPRPLGGRTVLSLAPGAVVRSVDDDGPAVEIPVGLRVSVDDPESAERADRAAWGLRWRRSVPGDRVRVVGTFQTPETGYRNPGAEGRRRRGASATLGPLLVHSPGDIEFAPPDGGRGLWNRFLGGVTRWRDAAHDSLSRAGGREAGPLLLAVVLGDTTEISPDQYRAFARTGLLHLFSVSGLHATIIALALFGVLTCLGFPRRYQMAAILAGVFLYAALTRFSLPVIRTTIMVAALGVQTWMRRPTDALSRLSLAAFAILILWPESLFQVDFQLSFLAVFTLIVFAPWVAETVVLFDREGGGWRAWALRKCQWLARAVVVMTILQLALYPILAHTFRQVSLIAPFANIVVIPVVTAALLAGTVIAGPGVVIPGLDVLVGPIAATLARVSILLTDAAAAIPFAAIPVRSLPPLGIVLYYAVLFGGSYLLFGRGPGDRSRRRAAAWIQLAGLGAVVVWIPFLTLRPPDRLRITFLDVGQGDCVLVELPDAGALLIDSGPIQPTGIARYTVEPVLRYRGIDTLDLALATHADGDHIGGFADVFDAVDVRRFASAVADDGGGTTWQGVLDAVRREGATPLTPLAGTEIHTAVPDLHIDILNPAGGDLSGGTDRNADSIVLRIAWKEFSVLLTGDADVEAERRMMQRWGADALRATVLKAGHHGSDSSTSEEFLDTVKPSVVVFSCGRRNRYGHPDPDVLARCRARGIEIHRTDLHGALVVETDGEKMWMTSYENSPEP